MTAHPVAGECMSAVGVAAAMNVHQLLVGNHTI
jgi:hypothetical protein